MRGAAWILAAVVVGAMGMGGVGAFGVGPDLVEVKVKPVVAVEARPFGPGEVKIIGGPFLKAQELGHQYLLQFDVDRLLAPYYMGLGGAVKKPPYSGGELQRNFIAGQMLGHWLAASSRMAAVTGDAELKKRVDQAVSELAQLQNLNGHGFVGPFPERALQETFAGTFNVGPGGTLGGQRVPWYVLHAMMAGLIEAYEFGGNKEALDVGVKLADWAKTGTDQLSDDQMQSMLTIEQGGISESFAELYALTGEKKYLELAKRFTHRQVIEPLSQGQEIMTGRHANIDIPKFVAAERVMQLTGEEMYGNAASNFWEEVVNKRTFVFGGCTTALALFAELRKEPLVVNASEECETYNMLRLTRELLNRKQESKYADYYERALINHILATQDPVNGTTMSFMSTRSGHFKVYGTAVDSNWCCTGTGLENPGRYTEAVYSHSEDTLWVNLYMGTELTWKEKGLTLRQETNFPEEAGTKLTVVTPPTGGNLTVKLRVPAWVAGEMKVKVNGSEVGKAGAGEEWVTVQRAWAKGDVVEVGLPMALRMHKVLGESTVAVMYGPVVLAAEMGREGMPADDHARSQVQFDSLATMPGPTLVSDKEEPGEWMKPVEGKTLTFKTAGAAKPGDVTLIPFYRLNHERYAIYFPVMTVERWAEAERVQKELDARTVDVVNPGEQQSEVAHRQAGQTSSRGNFNGRNWRDAFNGGFISYQMKVAGDAANVLRVTYWGSEGEVRVFDILVGGEKVGEQTLANNKPGEFFDVDYEIPEAVTKGKTVLEVKFQAHPGAAAGGLFGVRMMKK